MGFPKATVDTTLQVGSCVKNYVGDRGEVISWRDLQKTKKAVGWALCLLETLQIIKQEYNGVQRGKVWKQKQSCQQWTPMEGVLCFADLSSPGFEDQTSAARALKHCMGSAFVGTMFYMVEPRCTRQKYQFGPLVIVRSDVPHIPVGYPSGSGNYLSNLMKNISFSSAIPTGQQPYFCINECTDLELDMLQIVDTGTCSGKACDRALCLKKDQACGCFHTHFALGNHVGEFNLAFPSPLGKRYRWTTQ